MQHNNEKKIESQDQSVKSKHDLLYGIIAGATCTVIYNPIDKAIQAAQINKTSVFISGNFSKPYQGAVQASVQRMVFGTAYYWMQGFFRSEITPALKSDYHFPASCAYLVTGLTAGCVHGFVSNPTSLIKAQIWLDQSNTFWNRAKAFYHVNGVAALFRGTATNMLSSGLYGGLYEVTRHAFRHALKQTQPDQTLVMHYSLHFGCDLTASFICTAATSPINYARTLQYVAPPHEKSKSLPEVAQAIYSDFKSQPGSVVSRIGVFSKRVKMIEMATRTAFNMATGQIIVDSLRNRRQ